MKLKRLMAAMTFVAAGVATANAVAAVDPSIPSYTKTTGVSGNLSSVGSDTLANLMTLWAENYKKRIPERKHPDSGCRFFHRATCAD